MSLPQALPFETNLPEWVEDKIREVGEWSLNSQEQAWKRIVIVGELINTFPPRSAQRKEVQALVSEAARIKKSTQLVYGRICAALKDGDNLFLPVDLDVSTVRALVEHGATLSEIRIAHDEAWTLKRARAWALNRTKVTSEKPLSFMRHYIRSTQPEFRKRIIPFTDSEVYSLTNEYKRLLFEFAKDN